MSPIDVHKTLEMVCGSCGGHKAEESALATIPVGLLDRVGGPETRCASAVDVLILPASVLVASAK